MTDLSLYPAALFDQVDLIPGANSTLWGSSAVGGMIALQDHKHYTKGFHVKAGTTRGSFGFNERCVKLSFTHHQLSATSRFVQQFAQNDYGYTIPNSSIRKTQTNAEASLLHFLQSFHHRINARQSIDYHFWWNQADRNIAPLITQNTSAAKQAESGLRHALHWQRNTMRSATELRIGYFDEDLRYRDSISGVNSDIGFQTLSAEVESKFCIQSDFTNASWRKYDTAKRSGARLSKWYKTAAECCLSQYPMRLKYFKAQFDLRKMGL